jgi:hypothetical protein
MIPLQIKTAASLAAEPAKRQGSLAANTASQLDNKAA